MDMPLSRGDWTVEMAGALPEDGNRYEVIDGALLVTPAPSLTHQRAVALLFRTIDAYSDSLGLLAIPAPIGVTFSKRREVRPDLSVLPRTSNGRWPKQFSDAGRPILAVAVLSPSTARADRQIKRAVYQQEDVAEYWIIDTALRCFERRRRGSSAAEILDRAISWQPVTSQSALDIDLTEYFRQLLDE